MKTTRNTCLLLSLLALTAYVLPAPAPLAQAPQLALTLEAGRVGACYYLWQWPSDLTQVLAWLRAGGPFIQPHPGLLAQAAGPGAPPQRCQP